MFGKSDEEYFHYAIRNDYPRHFLRLLNKVNPDCIYDGKTPLMLAVQFGRHNMIRSLVNAGAKINKEYRINSYGYNSALDVAVGQREYESLLILIELGLSAPGKSNPNRSLFYIIRHYKLNPCWHGIQGLIGFMSKCDVEIINLSDADLKRYQITENNIEFDEFIRVRKDVWIPMGVVMPIGDLEFTYKFDCYNCWVESLC